MLEHLLRKAVAVLGRALLDIADIQHRLGRQQPEHAKGALFLRLALEIPRRLAFAQQHQRAVDEIELLLGVLVVALGLLGEIVDALFETVEIGEHQLGFDGLDIGQWRDLAFDMGDVGILKTSHHMRDRIDLADGGEELVAEAFALGGAADEAGDIDEGQPRRDDLRGFGDLRQLVEPGIGHRDLADIRLDGAERIIRRLRRGRLGQRVEQRRFADIGQPDDTAFKSHNVS